MSISKGDAVSISHHSSLNPFRSIVIEAENEVYTLRSNFELGSKMICNGDPVVLGFLRNSDIFMASGSILNMNEGDKTIQIKIGDFYCEEDEGIPVSLYAEIKHKEVRKRNIAVVKSLGIHQMVISSEALFSRNEKLEMELFIERKVFFLYAEVKEMKKNVDAYIYNIIITHLDFNSKNSLKLHLGILKSKHEQFVKKLKENITIF